MAAVQQKISMTQHYEERQLDLQDLTQLNPDWDFAESHGNSLRPGLSYKKNETDRNIQLCSCCLNQLQKQPIPLSQHTKELEVLGFGFPIYFSFLRNCILLLFILVVTYAAFTFYQGIQRNIPICAAYDQKSSQHLSPQKANGRSLGQTTQDGLFKCFTFLVSVSHIENTLTDDQIMLRFIAFFAIMIMLIIIKSQLHKLNQYFDQKTTSLSDFSIIIRGLPLVSGIQSKTKDFFNKQFSQSHEIKQITLIPILHQFRAAKREKKELLKKKVQLQKNGQNEQQIQIIQEQLNQKRNFLVDYCKKSEQIAQKDEMHTQKMILVFNTEAQKMQIIEEYHQIAIGIKQDYFGQQAHRITIDQAPQAKQIIWQHINYPVRKRIIRIVLVWLASIVFLAGLTVGFYYLIRAKSLLLQQSLENYSIDPAFYAAQRGWAIVLVYISLVLVILFNKLILGYIFHVLTELQYHETTSSEQLSFALKYALGLFFTTAVMTLAVEAFTLNNYYLHEYGVIEQQSIMFFLNAFFVSFIWLVNPWWIYRLIKQKCYFGSKNLTQQQANALMEPVPYDMGKRLAQILQTMWFTFLYVTIIPLGAFISMIGLICYYWIDKYNLLRRSGIVRHVTGELPIQAVFLLSFVLLLFPLGCLIYDYHLKDVVHWSTIFMLATSVVFIVFPWHHLVLFFVKQKFQLQKKTFDEVRSSFIENYHTLHPILRTLRVSKAVRNFKKFKSKRLEEKQEDQEVNCENKSNIRSIRVNTVNNGFKSQMNLLQTENA